MKINRIIITDFCGIENLTIDFEDNVTVIAGINGIGKSSILHAVKHLISYALEKSLSSKKTGIPIGNSAIKNEKKYTCLTGEVSCKELRFVAFLYRKAILTFKEQKELTADLQYVQNTYKQLKSPKIERAEMRDRIKVLKEELDPRKDTFSVGDAFENAKPLCKSSYPLAVFYSTTRLFSQKGLSSKLSSAKPLTMASANIDALKQNEISLNNFTNWYRSFSVLRKDSWGKMENQMQEAIKGILGEEFYSLTLVLEPKPRFTIKKNTEVLFLDQLSDGEQGLLSLVFDLTRRLAITNPNSEDPIKEGHALVLIDEIELHLHPAWQRRVIKRLTKTFANCQFIVTTHSPQVIGQTKPKNLRLLSRDTDGKVMVTTPNQSFGMDSSWILQNIMGASIRDYETAQRIENIYDAIDDEKFSQARVLAEELRSELGDFPDLQEIFAMLDSLDCEEDDA